MSLFMYLYSKFVLQVMHFTKTEFSVNGQNTIQKIGDPNYPLGNRNGPSDLDYQKIAAIYCNGVTRSPYTRAPTTPTTTTTTQAPAWQMQPCERTTTIDRTRGTIANQQVNGHYRPYEWCGWLITAPPGQIISAYFTYLDVETSPGCAKDQVTIFDGASEAVSPIIAGVCGINRPLVNYTSTSNKMLIFLSTDGSGEASGFRINYEAVDPNAEPAQPGSTSPADCNFESGMCSWAVDASSALKWKVASANSQVPGIPTDHTTGTNNARYMAINGTEATSYYQRAVMRSNRIYWADDFACLSFWYRLSDLRYRAVGELRVNYATSTGQLLDLWSSTSDTRDAYNQWIQVQIDLTRINHEFYRIIFNGSITYPTTQGGIAIDDVMLTQDLCYSEVPVDPVVTSTTPRTTPRTTVYQPGPSTNGISCDFESGYCRWSNGSLRADSSWLPKSGRSTPGSSFGVQNDNTRQTPAGVYMLLNSSPNQKKTARLETNLQGNENYKCFELNYLMFGKHLGRLRILARQGNDEMILFEARGNKDNKWKLAQASVATLNSPYTLIVEGYTTGQNDGDIGIDDFFIRTNDCYSPRPTQPVQPIGPTTTPYVTPNYKYLCDFEDGNFCRQYLALSNIGGSYSFLDAQGGTTGGPSTDHSRGNAQGRFAAFRGGYANYDTAILTTANLEAGEVNCMTFWYWLSPSDTGSIKIVMRDSRFGDRQLYSIDSSNLGTGQWINPQISLPRTFGPFQVMITATSGGYQSYIAIDDVELARNSKCNTVARMMGSDLGRKRRQAAYPISPLSCRFAQSNPPFCQYTSNGNWRAISTSAQVDQSGPDDRFAHMTTGRLVVAPGNSRSGGVFAPDAAAMTENVTGTLTSPAVSISQWQAQKTCLHFYWKISGFFRDLPMDTLNVYVQSANLNKARLVASYSGSFTPLTQSLGDWVEAQLTLLEEGDFRIIFEAVTGDSWIGSVAIDDIEMKPTICPRANY